MTLLELIITTILAIGATARLTRLLTMDSYPPVAKLRAWWERVTGDGDWSALATCPWCAAPWIAIPVLVTAWLFYDHLWWQAGAAWLTLAYVAAWIVAREAD